jgi:hypothetical protein
MTGDTEEPCCLWCHSPVNRAAFLRRRRRARTAPDLCLKCTLWAMTGQKPPYVVTELAYAGLTSAGREWPASTYPPG